MKNEREVVRKDLENAQLKLSQAEHQIQILENQSGILFSDGTDFSLPAVQELVAEAKRKHDEGDDV